jgi:exodeoxyribonuclease VIII
MPFDEYAKVEAVNWSTLKELRRSPLHYRHRLEVQRKDTARLALGRAAHTAVFEPDRFLLEYACFKGPIRRGKKWEAFKEQHQGETILKLDEYSTCLAIRDAVRSHPAAAEYLRRGKAEQTIQWTHEGTGLACKGRVDWISESKPAMVDLKTTGDVETAKFTTLSYRMGYHCQGAFYVDGLRQVLGKELPAVVIAVEAKPPHDVAIYRFSEDAIYAASEEIRLLMETLVACRQVDKWQGRYPDEMPLELPRWTMDDEGDTDLEDEITFSAPANGHGAQEE